MMQRIALAMLAALALVSGAGGAACGGGEDPDLFPDVVLLGSGDIFPAINNTSLAVGENRVTMSLTDENDDPVLDADVHLRFFDLTGEKPRVAFEADATFIPLQLGYVDEQSGGKRETTGDGGAYVANVAFPHEGAWGVKVRATTLGRRHKETPFRFNVLQDTPEPSIGDAAPRSVQQVLANVADVSEIDSSSPPRPRMHDKTIADAVAAGRPVVIAFATPAFCTSRLCAPVMDTVMDPLADEFGGEATFIHVEPYVLRDLRNGFVHNPVPAAREWNLQTEPWIFIAGRDGRIAAKFEGPAGLEEVRTALQAALDAP